MTTFSAPPAERENVLGLRALATIVDGLVFLPVWFLFVLLFGETETGDGSFSANLGGVGSILLMLAYMGYAIVMEGLKGQTVGKMATGIYVMTEDGRQPEWGAVVIRNVLRLVDVFPYFIPYVVGFICAAVTKKHQRLGDIAGKTIVSKKWAVE